MTRKEYSDKWCKECMNCEHLMVRQYNDKIRDSLGNRISCGSWVFCIWAEGRMNLMPEESNCEEMTRKMVLGEKNIWIECPTYTERMVELYNLDD